MPGVFSPVLQEEGTAIQPLSPTQSYTANALDGFNNLLYSAGRSYGTSDSSVSQKDRDNATLQPVFETMASLKAQKDNETISPLKYRQRANQLVIDASTQNPMLQENILAGAKNILGIEVGETEMFPEEAAYQDKQRWLQTPEGVAAFYKASSSVFQEKGYYDPAEANRRMDELYFGDLSRQLGIKRMGEQVAAAEADDKIRGYTQDRNADVLMQQHTQKSTETAEMLINNFSKTATSGVALDSNQLLEVINGQIALLTSQFSGEQATAAGSSTNYKLDQALAPLTALKTMVENNRDNLPKFAQALSAQGEVVFGQVVKKVMGLTPPNQDITTAIFNSVGLAKADTLRTIFETPDTFLGMENQIFGPGITNTTTTEGDINVNNEPGNVFDPSLAKEFEEAGPEETKKAAAGSFVMFETTPPEMFAQDQYREAAANYFGQGVAATLALEGQGPLSDKSLKKIFSPEFFRRYDVMAGKKDMSLSAVQQTSAMLLSHQMAARQTIIEQDIKNWDGYAGLKFGFENGKIILRFDSDSYAMSANQKEFIKSLGGDPTLDKAYEWASQRRYSRDLGVQANPARYQELIEKVNELNEVYKITQRFGDMKDQFTTAVQSRFQYNSAGQNVQFAEISSADEFDSVKSGSIVIIRNPDGSIADITFKE